MSSLDEVFRLLSRERRRYALYYLRQQDGPVTIEQLARTISEWESDPSDADVPDELFENVVLTLDHNHFPKRAEADSIEYDRENRQVRITDTASEIDVMLSIAHGLEQPSTDLDVLDLVSRS
ncbi:hypothetical protein ACFQFH_13285 [Halobaculum halobium]|uniref:DUF7344 domain-containing protein n=1 Tax=Halobaculum halobium TaxID=3032281 RepID=A0ABD5TBW0_9EURY|nr:hypothetical protein [Halobaculum sp. SYNS20]